LKGAHRFQRLSSSAFALHGLETKLKKVEAAIQNNMAVIDSGLVTDSIKSHLLELEAEKSVLQKSIAKEKMREPVLERDTVVYFLERFRNGDTSDVGWRIFLVDTFLKAAYLYDNGDLLLCLNFSGDRSKISLKIAENAVKRGEELCSNFAPSCPPKKILTEKSRYLFLFSKKCKKKRNPEIIGITQITLNVLFNG